MKQLKLDQAVRNLTFGDLEIRLVVIGLGVTGLKKTGVVYILGFWREGGEVVVSFRVCEVLWANDWANVGSIDFFSTFVFHVLVKDNGMEFKDKIKLPCFREVKYLKGLKLCFVWNFQSHI